MVTTGAQLTPTVAPVVRLPVTNVRLSSTRSAVVMKLFDPDPSLPSADWTILLLTLTLTLLLLRLRLRLLLLRLLRPLRGRRRVVLRLDTEHLVRRPRRASCRRRRRRRRRRHVVSRGSARARSLSPSLASLSQSLTPPHAVPLNALVSVSLSLKMQARNWSWLRTAAPPTHVILNYLQLLL